MVRFIDMYDVCRSGKGYKKPTITVNKNSLKIQFDTKLV